MDFFHSIKFRFTIWYLAVLAILMVLLSTGIYLGLSHSLHQNLDDSLKLRAEQLKSTREGILTSISQGKFQEDLGEVVAIYFYHGGELVQLSARGIDIPTNSQMVGQAINGQRSFATVRTDEGKELRLYAVPFAPPGKPGLLPGRRGLVASEMQHGALVVGRSTEDIDHALARLISLLVIAVPLTLVVAGAGGIFLARRALKPVDQIAQTAHHIEETDLTQRIKVDTKDELGRLASTLNQMIERLERAFKRQQEFTGDASHELRTPLAVIEAESTLALQKERKNSDYRRSLELISQEASHMSGVIDQLLALARADSGKEQLAFTTVNLGELLDDVASDALVLCREKGLTFESGQIQEIVVKGDAAKLKQLFLNLLANAVRYTPSGGSISLSLARENRFAVVTLKDTGIGIPPEDLPHIFERFYRVDKARARAEGGSGLGLAICRHIAEIHGGRIEGESKVGEGSTFSVYLPIAW